LCGRLPFLFLAIIGWGIVCGALAFWVGATCYFVLDMLSATGYAEHTNPYNNSDDDLIMGNTEDR
jgi:hypothetical protein